MSIPQHVIDWIESQSPDFSQSDATIAAGLNAILVDNPFPRPTVLANPVMAETALLSLLTDTDNQSAAKLLNWPNLGLVKSDIDNQNRAGVAAWANKLQLNGILTAGEGAAIVAYLEATGPDPNYSTTAPASFVALGRPVDIGDVYAARPGA